MNRRTRILASVSTAVLMLGLGAHAQEESGESEGTELRQTLVTITAQKREQSLQDVPIVVTALPTQLIEDAGIRDLKDLTILTPGLLVTSSASQSDTTARIRGIGTVGNNPGLESSVGVSIDGVSRARNGVAFGDLGEIERIEVLKGPQGTLFGKSTSAGVINIISKGPEEEFGADLEVTAGNFGLIRTSGTVTGPFSDSARGRLFGVYSKRDGFMDVNTGIGPRTETEDTDFEFYSLRGQLEFDLGSEATLRVIADYTDREENCCLSDYISQDPGRSVVVNLLAGGNGTGVDGNVFSRQAFGNRDAGNELTEYGVSAELNWNLSFGTLTSITSYRNWDNSITSDPDYSGADIWYRDDGDSLNEFTNISQEFRLAGATDSIDWLIGAYLANEELDRRETLRYGTQYFTYWNTLFGGALTPFEGAFWEGEEASNTDLFSQEATTLAVFTHNTIALNDKIDATVGVRFTSDEKDLDATYNSASGSCNTTLAVAVPLTAVGCLPWSNDRFDGFTSSQSRTDEELSGTFKLSYKPTEDLLTYASYARGYKAGGFNLDRAQTGLDVTDLAGSFQPIADTAFEPETVDAYELGAKWNNASESFFLNGALFSQDYQDFQLNTFTGTSFIVTSTPEVTSRGVDLDFRYLPVDAQYLTLQGGLTFAETQYGDFDPAPINAPPRLPDNTISFAPKWSGSLAATLDSEFLADWDARWNVSMRYTSPFNSGSNLDPQKEVGEVTIVNARLAIFKDESPVTVELWAQNLFDEDYLQVAFDTPLQGSAGSAISSFLSPPRTYGLTVKAEF